MAQISITFARGARRVTGSNFLVTITDEGRTTRILIDCGLTQGEQFCDPINGETFTYDPTEIDAVFFTHAHTDHIGLFPKLVKDGFKGKAYATAPTRDLMPVMLEDSVSLMRTEATRCGTDVPYVMDDVVHALKMLTDIPYGETVVVGDARVTLLNAGHILGSALVQIDAGGKRVVFTGDLGRVQSILAPDRDVPEGVDVLVTESVYGNRTHASVSDSEQELAAAVQRSYKEQGTLLIPAFSLERTQIILAALDRMMTEGTIPQVPVYMDSPLAAKVTDIYRAYPAFLRPEVRERLERGDDPFSFATLRVTVNTESSYLIDGAASPKIVIAGAGMSHGGRIRHHEQKYLPLKNTTLLLVGYQVAGSLGRRLKDGQKEVAIDGVKVKVRARVLAIGGFSAHADRDDIVSFVEAVKPKRVFVVLGETEAATFLAQRISGFLGLPTDVPQEGETYEL